MALQQQRSERAFSFVCAFLSDTASLGGLALALAAACCMQIDPKHPAHTNTLDERK